MDNIPDIDPEETREWLAALDGVLAAEGADRAQFLIEALIDKARRSGAYLPFSANTALVARIAAVGQSAPNAAVVNAQVPAATPSHARSSRGAK